MLFNTDYAANRIKCARTAKEASTMPHLNTTWQARAMLA